MQASWHFSLTSYLLGWTTPELRGHDPWVLPGFLGSSSLQGLIQQDSSKQILEEPVLPLTFTSLTNPSLFVSTRSSRAPFLVSFAVTWARNLSMHSRYLLEVMLYCFSGICWGGWSPPQRPAPVNVRLLLAVCRKPHPLFLPDQVSFSRHALQCHPYWSVFSSLPISSPLDHHPSPDDI